MKKTISFFQEQKALFCGVLLTGALMLCGAVGLNAQQSANGTVNPDAHLAEKLNVTAYPLGTFDRAHTMDVMENILTGMQQVIGSGNATTTQKLKFQFCKAVLADVSNEYIATEIALLNELSALNTQQSTIANQQSVLATIYNEVVSQLQ